ncbi:MAG: ATP-binding protein [Defluviitaleaceae bacterium]|nr:ATP-binding protein [Defluviitaleaceae bacterium]
MKNITIIRILIVLFVVLSGASIVFVWIADATGMYLTKAQQERYDFSVATGNLRASSIYLSRQASRFVASGRPRNLEFYLDELDADHMGILYELFSRHELTYEEFRLLYLVRESFYLFRDFEFRAFAAMEAGDYDLAFELIFGPAVRIYSNAFESYLYELFNINSARQYGIIADAMARDSLFKVLVQVAVGIFGVISVGGMFYLLVAVKNFLKREKDANEMTNLILDHAPIAVSIWDEAINPIRVNGQVAQMLDLGSKDLYVTNFLETSPEYQPCGTLSSKKVLEVIGEAFRTGFVYTEWMHQTSKGDLVPCEAKLIRFTSQDIPLVAVYIIDLRQAKAIMQQEAAMEAMRSESQAKTRFLARMSHEIRTPLSSIMGIAEIQLQTGALNDVTEEAFNRVYNSSNMLLTIINDILDITKIEVEKMDINPAPYKVAGLIVDAVQLNSVYIGSRGIDFKLDVDKALPVSLIGDELRLKQIFNNILSNAFKYTKKGIVTLSIGMEKGEIDDEITLIVTASDTGIGMSPEQIEILFVEYQRADTKDVRHVEGAGLGMSIVYQLIHLMGGTIDVESEIDVGTTITVRMPQKIDSFESLGADVVRELEMQKESHVAVVRNRYKIVHEPMPYGKVLVVDDVESNLYVAKGLLMPYGLSIDTASNGQEAVDKIRAGEVYDVIFMDHMMPRMDGIEATQLIKQSGYTHPIVVLTANTVKGQAERFLAHGFSAFISKPIDVRILDECLLQFIRDKQPADVIQKARATSKTASMQGIGHKNEPSEIPYELLMAFLRDINRVIGVIKPIAQENVFDADNIKRFITSVHAIRSALTNLGKTELSRIASALESDAHEGKTDGLSPRVLEFVERLGEVASQLEAGRDKTLLGDFDDDIGFLLEGLGRLSLACDNFNIKDANRAISEMLEASLSKSARDNISELSFHLLSGDFENTALLAKQIATNLEKSREEN